MTELKYFEEKATECHYGKQGIVLGRIFSLRKTKNTIVITEDGYKLHCNRQGISTRDTRLYSILG
jgi:hypothetical protein